MIPSIVHFWFLAWMKEATEHWIFKGDHPSIQPKEDPDKGIPWQSNRTCARMFSWAIIVIVRGLWFEIRALSLSLSLHASLIFTGPPNICFQKRDTSIIIIAINDADPIEFGSWFSFQVRISFATFYYDPSVSFRHPAITLPACSSNLNDERGLQIISINSKITIIKL